MAQKLPEKKLQNFLSKKLQEIQDVKILVFKAP